MKVITEKLEGHKIYREIWLTVLKNTIDALWAIMVYYTGPKGSGKSYGAISDAFVLDSKFTVEQVLFRKEEVIDFVDTYSYEGGRVAIWDEFGSEMHGQEWFKEEQRELVQLLEIIRETDLTFLVCLPHLNFGNSSVEALANYCMELYQPKHRDDKYRVGKALEIHGLYSKRMRMEFKPLWLDGKILHVKYLDPTIGKKIFFRNYHKKKTQYVKWKIDQIKNKRQKAGLTTTQTDYLKAFLRKDSISDIASDMKVSEQSVKEMKRKLRRKGVLE